ncbi:hypothetical protein AB0M92_20115 [Streptomyces sp. NPDC051582]|uniref:hypothetical protein n=1 Tax=Streptomyces sp. NPDC051582 TaxID=3155167 RepID=UPI00343E0B45
MDRIALAVLPAAVAITLIAAVATTAPADAGLSLVLCLARPHHGPPDAFVA